MYTINTYMYSANGSLVTKPKRQVMSVC